MRHDLLSTLALTLRSRSKSSMHPGYLAQTLAMLRAEVPAGPGMGMLFSCHGVALGPREQFVGRDGSQKQLQMLLRVVADALRELVGVCQEEVHVKGAGRSEHLHRGL